jgi:hypothetical protein
MAVNRSPPRSPRKIPQPAPRPSLFIASGVIGRKARKVTRVMRPSENQCGIHAFAMQVFDMSYRGLACWDTVLRLAIETVSHRKHLHF